MAAPIFLTVLLVAIVVGGAFARDYLRTSKEHNRLFRKDMNEMKLEMAQLKSDMSDLKELVHDTIIEQS